MSKNSAEQATQQTIVPPVDVMEDSGGITLVADLPGVPKEGLQLHVESDQLTIEGIARLEGPPGLQLTHQEVPALHYRRVFTLSKELDPEQVTAVFEHGVLRLRIPRVQQARPRRIQIQVG